MTKLQLPCQIYVSQVSGGEGQALPPLLIFRPNWDPKGRKQILETAPHPLPPLPYLKVWIRHCKHYIKSCKEQKINF